MAKFFLLNNIRVGTTSLYAGSLIDDQFENVAQIRSAGGVLITQSNGPVAAAAALAQKIRRRGGSPAMMAEIVQSALDFQHERSPKGANLGDTAPTIQWSDGVRRVLPAATLTAGRVLTLGVAAGADGRLPRAFDRWEITRLDATANTYTINNGGPGAGTLKVMAVSVVNYLCAEFDGTNWELVQ